MKAFFISILISVFALSSTFAAEGESGVSKEELVEIAKEYHLSQFIKTKTLKAPLQSTKGMQIQGGGRRCEDNSEKGPSGRCVDLVCEKLGTYGCDSQSELSEVAMICSSQYNESCMASSCRRLGTYGCDSISELKEVSGLCENVRSSGCVDQVCERLGTYGCDSVSELKGAAQACSGIRDTGCITKLCERLGTYGCDSLSEIEAVARTCKGR